MENKMKNEQVIILQFPPWYNRADLSYGKKATAKYILLVIIKYSKIHKQHILFYSFLFDS